MSEPIVVVGAGVAGLAAAKAVHEAGRRVVVLESADRIGGKVRTDVVEGFRLDRGYQVHFAAYPNLAKVAPPEALAIGAYRAGAIMRDRRGSHVLEAPRSPRALVRMALDRSVSLSDKLRVGAWTARTMAWSVETIRALPDFPAADELARIGFSPAFREAFLRPFLGGIFLDRSLSFSRRQFAFVWKMLASGAIGLPAEGMEAIPRLIASALPGGSIRLSARVSELRPRSDGGEIEVRLSTHETIRASAVILAADARESARLVGERFEAEYNGMVQVWLECAERPMAEPMLLLNGTGEGIVNTLSPSSMAQPSYAPKGRGRGLLGATIVGGREESDDEIGARAAEEAERLAPEAGVRSVLAVQRIPEAHLRDAPGFERRRPKTATAFPGVFLAGEATTNTSLDGAAESGLRAARRVLGG